MWYCKRSRIIVGGGNVPEITKRLEKAEDLKRKMEYQFFQIKDELGTLVNNV